MRGFLSVRVNDGYTDRMVTSRTTGLRFRKTAPGGHHSASCTISVPRDTFRDLGPADKLYIYDARTGGTVWEGYTENPGATDGPSGQSYELQASGGMILAQDQSTPVIFVDRSLDDGLWVRNDLTGGTVETFDSPTLGVAFKMQFPSGQPVGTATRAGWQYRGLVRTGQTLYGVFWGVQPGKVDANYAVELTTRTAAQAAAGTSSIISQTAWSSTAPNPSYAAMSPGQFSTDTQSPTITLIRLGGATNVADDLTYQTIYNARIRANLLTATGGTATPVANDTVRADEVVNHLLGGKLPLFDGAAAQVDAGSYAITQLTYHDGATPGKILDDLSLYEPDLYWGVGPTGPTGKHEFWYRAWQTTPRYEISVKDGYTAPGGEVDLCNRIVVYYTDTNGAKQSVTVTQTVPELGSRTRDAQAVTLPEGSGSAANAQRVGAMVLAQKTAAAPKAATAVVRRPILDSLRGCMVMPWEIEPGYVVRVRETGEDLRLTEMEYTDADCSATLTLGTPTLSAEQILASVAA